MTKRKDIRQFSVSFPDHLTKEIDIICNTNYITRSSWLIAAAKEKLENDRSQKIEKLKNKLKQEDL